MLIFNVFQMAVWLPSTGKLYLPPARPTPRVLHTDEYVKTTNVFFSASTDRLLTVGHPYFPIHNSADPTKIDVPKVSGSQYRVFRFRLPDPNKFALIDPKLFNPDEERLVWKLKAVELGRGGPLGVAVAGHPYFNKLYDVENPGEYPPEQGKDNRVDMASEPKQNQLFILGCKPAIGEYWDKAKPCDNDEQKGACPPIMLVNATIEDGQMSDTGFGAINYDSLCEDRSSYPMDIISEKSLWPDFLKMNKQIYGDHIFFFGQREQLYTRHYAARGGKIGDTIPDTTQGEYYYPPQTDVPQNNIGSHVYFTSVSGSLTSTESQIFNRPYFLQKAQGLNNGICWVNDLFVTILDNTRNTNFNISVYNKPGNLDVNTYRYTASDFTQYTRHTEEYEFDFVFQLCKVSLTADVLAHLHVMNPEILEGWNLAFVPPAQTGIEDAYRYLTSLATMCPTEAEKTEKEDPYKGLNFWNVDMSEKFTSELSQSYLGRRFLYQMGMLSGTKRVRTEVTVNKPRKSVKRRKTRA